MSNAQAPIPERIGRYEVTERIAHGRTSDVLLATSHGVAGFRRNVVVRLLNTELSAKPEFLKRHLAQVRQLFALSHVNIVQAQDLAEEEEQYYLVQEHVEGYDLATLRDLASSEQLTMSAPLGLLMVAEVVKGVDFAHRRLDPKTRQPLNLAHGDLHPRNILMGFGGQVKLNDFGLYRPLEELAVANELDMVRAYAYAAPEVAAGALPTPRSDLYSIGLLALEVCAGKHPYASATASELKRKAEAGEIDPRTMETIPESLRAIMSRTLRLDPAERMVDLGVLYDWIISYLHRKHSRIDSAALGEFVEDVGDADLRSAVVYSGIIATEHGVRVTTPAAGMEVDGDVWATAPSLELFRGEKSDKHTLALAVGENRPLTTNGREPEIEHIRARLNALGTDGCGGVFVSGPRGIGKTHLMHTAHRRLLKEGYRSVFLAPDLDSAAHPYGLVLDWLSKLLMSRPLLWSEDPGDSLREALEKDEVGDEQARETLWRLCELRGPAMDLLVVRQALGRILSDLVEGRMGHVPLAVFIDGPEKADILSLELIHALLSTQRPGPLLLVVGSLHKALLNQLSRATPSDRRSSLVLAELLDPALARLLRRISGKEGVDEAVIDACDGSPQRALEIGLALRFGGYEGRRPEHLSRFVDQFEPAAVKVMGCLAATELALPSETIARTLAMDSEEVRKQCRALATLHLMVRRPHGGWHLGPRPLYAAVLRVVQERADRVRRRLAYLITSHHGGPIAAAEPQVVRLLAHAGERRLALRAGRSHVKRLVELGFTDVALSYLDGLSELAGERVLGDPTSALNLQLQRVQLALSAMRLEHGRQILAYLPNRAEEIHNEDGVVRSFAQQARFALRRGELEAAEDALERLTPSLGRRTATEARALVWLARGELQECYGRVFKAQDCLRRALWLLSDRRGNGAALAADVRVGLGKLLVRSGNRGLARRLLPESESAPIAIAHQRWRGFAALLDEDFDVAVKQLGAAFDTARRIGRAADCLAIGPELLEAYLGQNDLESASDCHEDLAALAERYGASKSRARLVDLGRVLEPQNGLDQLTIALEDAEHSGDLARAVELSWYRWRAARKLGKGAQDAASQARELALKSGDTGRAESLANWLSQK